MALNATRGLLNSGSNLLTGLTCTVHSVVLLNIVDSYRRRNEDAKRVIGTLIGSVDKGVVEVTGSFTVPHNESEDEVAVDIDFAKNMFELHKKVNPQEVIVGWYSTGYDIIEHSVLIHDYYSRECKNPIHLMVDTSLRTAKMAIKAYVSVPVGVPDRTLGSMFIPIPLELVCQDQEKVGLDQLINFKDVRRPLPPPLPTDVVKVSKSCSEMLHSLGRVVEYVEGVLSGNISSDSQVGRLLMELVNSVTKIDPKDFEEIINANMKDLLMMVYLSNLTKTQLIIGEKLNLI